MPRASDRPPRTALLRWYDRNKRDLPWRRTRDPYAIWVSEVMAQQTRIETVIGYYGRFMERFPTTASLAAAAEDEVLSMWSGLGYYRRARLLQQGVREVVVRYGGEVPSDAESRRALPGIGRYTAGAIGSIAFDRPEPIVDGNVARVLSRVHGVETPLGRADTETTLWAEAERWVQGPRPGDLNQALMELGATLCTPRAPSCETCPLRANCVALRDARTTALPVPRLKKPPREVFWVALLATSSEGEVWLTRGDAALFGGLWNLPMAEGRGRVAASELASSLGLRGTLGARSIGRVEHVLSHRRLRVQAWRLTRVDAPPGQTLRSVPIARLDELGISRLTHKLLDAGPRARSAR